MPVCLCTGQGPLVCVLVWPDRSFVFAFLRPFCVNGARRSASRGMAQIETRWAYIQMLWGICGIGMRRCSQADRRYADCGLRIFDFRYLTFVARCWILNTGYSIFDTGCRLGGKWIVTKRLMILRSRRIEIPKRYMATR